MAYTLLTVNDIASSWLALVWTGKIAIPDTLEKGRKEWAENWVRAGEHDNRAMPSSILQFSILAASKEEHAGGFREEAVKARLEWGGTYVEWIEEKGLEREDVPDEVCSIEVGKEEQD
uniref:Uncharacterized protein n=1 Tax=Moniliophthora roreri TaxID=221103 RepID=A0A0W0FA55_MONRR